MRSRGESFDVAARRAIEAAAARATEPIACPACGGRLSLRVVPPPPQVAYVRRRAWVLCPDCRRSAAIDLPPAGANADD